MMGAACLGNPHVQLPGSPITLLIRKKQSCQCICPAAFELAEITVVRVSREGPTGSDQSFRKLPSVCGDLAAGLDSHPLKQKHAGFEIPCLELGLELCIGKARCLRNFLRKRVPI